MTRRPCNFRQRDLAAALKAARDAGVLDRVKIEIEAGKVTVTMADDEHKTRERTDWDNI